MAVPQDTTPKPRCPKCGREMQLNTPASNDYLKQYICGCNGGLKYENVHAKQVSRGSVG